MIRAKNKNKHKNKHEEAGDSELEVRMEKTHNATNKDEDLEIEDITVEDIKEIEILESGAIIIDRDEEDADVKTFQKTGDLKLLEKLYKNRIPTLKSWANKHYYPGLTYSVEDLFEELSFVFVKAAQKYEPSRGNFNNCLFTFLINRLRNMKSSKHAKKRMSEEYDGPMNAMILSLDYAYNDKDGTEMTLKDIIANKETKDKGYIHRSTSFDETIKILSGDEPVFKEFLKKISNGGSLTALLKEYKTKTGKIKITNSQIQELNKRKNKKTVHGLIKAKENLNGDFKVIDYSLDNTSNLTYEIEMKKTKETDSIMKNIRELRKNKHSYVEKIRGMV